MIKKSKIRYENTPCIVSVNSNSNMPTGREILSMRIVAIQIRSVEKAKNARGGEFCETT